MLYPFSNYSPSKNRTFLLELENKFNKFVFYREPKEIYVLEFCIQKDTVSPLYYMITNTNLSAIEILVMFNFEFLKTIDYDLDYKFNIPIREL